MGRFALCAMIVVLQWLAGSLNVRAEIVVIVHPDNPISAMTQREVSDLYLGRARSFSQTGDSSFRAVIYEHPSDSPVRESFFRALNGMSQSQVNAYWARLRFSGEVLPPPSLADSQAIVEIVGRDRNAIGYVDASLVKPTVKIVLRLK